jgi:glycosyltransferase domain-containing protein
MQTSDKVTIVLTLKDRAPFTYRWVRYMNDMRCPYKILIADGGEDKTIEQHLKAHENYPCLDYDYIRYPYDSTLDDYYKKFIDIISKVKTEYLLLADNDDFYLLDRIPDILTFLDTHKDYVGARGQLVNLTLYDKSGLSNGLTSGMRYKAVQDDAPSIESHSPFERVDALCNDMKTYDYYANWYCIFRTVSIKKIWELLITLSVKEVIVTEVLTHVLLVAGGKIKIMSFPFYIRQSNTSMFGDTLVVGNEFLERCIVNNALSEFGIAVDQFFSTQTREEKDRILRAIAAWLEIFVSNIYWGRIRSKRGFIFRMRGEIRRVPVLEIWIMAIYNRFVRLFSSLPQQKRKNIHLKTIEPYIRTN